MIYNNETPIILNPIEKQNKHIFGKMMKDGS
jgi:hypothetical protein